MKEQMQTDFSTWERATLERLARELADENEQLKKDLKTAMTAWRVLLKKIG